MFLPKQDNMRKIDLPDNVLLSLLLFLDQFSFIKFRMLSKAWYCRIDLLLSNMCKPMEADFINQYIDYVEIKNKRLVFSPAEFGHDKGIRVDRILEFELLERSPEVCYNVGRTFKIENLYQYIPNTAPKQSQKSVVFRPNKKNEKEEEKSHTYSNCYRFDIIKTRQHSRKTWVHISDAMPGYSQNEIQVAPGDRVEIALCIFNLNGLVNLQSLTWNKPKFAKIESNLLDFTTYNRDLQSQKFA